MNPRPSTRPPTNRSIRSITEASNSSFISSTQYPKCVHKKQHQKQMMNLVCLTPSCKTKGGICSMCKVSEHSTHLVLPIKSFLTTLSQNISKNKKQSEKKEMKEQEEILIMQEDQGISTKKAKQEQDQNNFESIIAMLRSFQDEMFSVLTYYVKKISGEIENIEKKIVKDFRKIEEQVSNLFNSQKNVGEIVERFIDSPPKDSEQFQNQMKYLLDILTIKSKTQFEIKNNAWSESVKQWKNKGQIFKNNIQLWGDNTLKTLKFIFDEGVVKKNSQSMAEEGSSSYKFSSQCKQKTITIANENNAKQTGTKGGLILLEGQVKNKTVRFRIKNITASISVGIGMKDTLKSKGYVVNFASLGHGTFMNSSNTYLYNNYEKNLNMLMQGIKFEKDSQISVSVKDTSLEIAKGDKKCSISLKKMTEADWKQAKFCVNLGGNGDCIEIIE